MQVDLKWNNQCKKAVNIANRALGMIKRTFRYFSKDIILQLYKTFGKPRLDYCIDTSRPYIKFIELLEMVQMRTTKLVSSMNSYRKIKDI